MGIFGQGKKDLEKQIEDLKRQLNNINLTIEQTKYLDLNKEIQNLKNTKVSLESENISLQTRIAEYKKTLLDFDELEEMQSFGFYKPKYNFDNSTIYKSKLDDIKSRQKDMVRHKVATNHSLTWTIDNDKKRGKEFILDSIKLLVRAFNNECDNIISKVKFSNVSNSENKIRKVYNDLNKLTDMQRVSLTNSYLQLKLEELYLKYEFECKLQEEKEEQKEIKERMREEARVAKELEAARKKIEKEETHFSNAIKDLNDKLANSPDKEKNLLLNKLKELEKKLAEIQNSKKDLDYREQNTRAGYVYVISNIGSFGENIYKIGMTRRLEPMDRVKELGDASVPFAFDVHALIFSENAPTLENALHKKFEKNSVNKINMRKEFFNVSLKDIKEEVEKNHNATVEFTMIAQANEYRQSLAIDQKNSRINQTQCTQTKSISSEENQAVELIRNILSGIVDKYDITYTTNGNRFDILYKNNPKNWICHLFLNKKPQKGLSVPDDNGNPIEYDFDDIKDLQEIDEIFKNIIKVYV